MRTATNWVHLTLFGLQQNLKDSIVVTTVGAEVLPFLEAYGVLPASLLFFMFFKVIVSAGMPLSMQNAFNIQKMKDGTVLLVAG
eukprot:1159976-Pelagomonas_calceolata.AAC.3